VRPVAIEEARSRFALADVAERTGIYVPRFGGSVMVHCPFPAHGHYDTSPSLRLHLDDGIWHCFGCGSRGDVIEWVRQTEGVGWPEAIRVLDQGDQLTNAWAGARDERPDPTRRASGAGLDYPDPTRTSASRVLASLAAAWRQYTRPHLHDRGVEYLVRRGIDVGVLERHVGRCEVGHTPPTRTGLVSALRQQGFSDDELVDAGLASRRLEDALSADYYRQRVLVPVRDQQGRVCGLIGRNIGDARWPKYKNPPRTVAYDKSINLYQPLPAPLATRVGRVVVVEGTIDAMAIAVAAIQAGRATAFCPVTQSGRELSSVQLDYVLTLSALPPIIGFDGDSPGRESSARLVSSAAQRGVSVLVTTLPEGHDPASWLADRGPRGLRAWISEKHDNAGMTRRRTGSGRVDIVAAPVGNQGGARRRGDWGSNGLSSASSVSEVVQSDSWVPTL
jgi:DNA primase